MSAQDEYPSVTTQVLRPFFDESDSEVDGIDADAKVRLWKPGIASNAIGP
jgi:hypothetical protein